MLTRSACALLLLMIGGAGCATPAPPVGIALADADGVGRLTAGGFQRRYLLSDSVIPAGAPRPLLVVLHGGGGAAENVKKRLGFDRLARRDGFIVAYPDSQLDRPGAPERNWNDGRDVPMVRGDPEVDDVRFIGDLLDRFVASGTVDRRRIYIVGASNGGMMTFRLACEMGDRIAAIGVVMASLPVGAAGRCRTTAALPAMFIRGDLDDTLPFDGGRVRSRPEIDRGAVVSMADTISWWKGRNGCEGEPVATAVADGPSPDGTRATRFDWPRCRSAPLAYYLVTGGGHQWPGVPVPPERIARSGPTNLDFDSATEIWRFMSPHRTGAR